MTPLMIPLLWVAYAGIALQGLSLCIVIGLVVLHYWRRPRLLKRAAELEGFSLYLAQRLAGLATDDWQVPLDEAHANAWLRFYWDLQQDGRKLLREIPVSRQLSDLAARWLAHEFAASGRFPQGGKRRARLLLSLSLAGALNRRDCYPRLLALARSDDTPVALAAARSALRLRPREAIGELLPFMLTRPDWEEPYLAAALEPTGTRLSLRLQAEPLLRQAQPVGAARLLRAFARVDPIACAQVSRKLLNRPAGLDDQVLGACLDILVAPEDKALALPYIAHPRRHLRIRAAKALGRLGDLGQEGALLTLASDQDPWVSRRALEALRELPGQTVTALAKTAASRLSAQQQAFLLHA